MYNITLKRVRATIEAVEKATSNTQPLCVFVALGMQHAMCTILSFVVCPTLKCFSTLCHKWHDFEKSY